MRGRNTKVVSEAPVENVIFELSLQRHRCPSYVMVSEQEDKVVT